MRVNETLVMVRGGGDLATGTIHCLASCGFKVIVLEVAHPTAIRRGAAFCEAMQEASATVERLTARKVSSPVEITRCWQRGEIPMLADEDGAWIARLHPHVVVDAIVAKKNNGTHRDMAPLVIGLGPGFTAGDDVHVVIETMRGHRLGRIITEGQAQPNTGVPGVIAGYSSERVIHAPASGVMKNICKISDIVKKGQVIAYIMKNENFAHDPIGDGTPVVATLDGVLRGLLRDGLTVPRGFKIADIDPRISEQENCFTISDKARTIAGGVLQAILMYGGVE